MHNYQSGALMKCFDPHSSQVSSLIYLDDVKQVVSTSWDGAVVIHDENPADHGLILRTMDAASTHRGDITCTAVSLKQMMIATGAADKTVRVWDLGTGKVLEVLHFEYEINHVVFLEPFPAIIIADTIGWLHLYGVHGSRFKYNSPLKFKHMFLHGGTKSGSDNLILGPHARMAEGKENALGDASTPIMSPVLALEWRRDACVLYTGGDRGQILAWDLAPALLELGQFDPAFRGKFKSRKPAAAAAAATAATAAGTTAAREVEMVDEGKTGGGGAAEGATKAAEGKEADAGRIVRTVQPEADASAGTAETKESGLGIEQKSQFGAEGKMASPSLRDRTSSFSVPAVAGKKNKYNPVLDPSSCKLLWSVHAHTDSVSSLHLIDDSESTSPAALLSASYDHTVRIWGTDGEQRGVRLGSLLQGIRGRKRHPKWDFHVDVGGIERRETQEIQHLTRALEKRRSTMASLKLRAADLKTMALRAEQQMHNASPKSSGRSYSEGDSVADYEDMGSSAEGAERIPPPWDKIDIERTGSIRAQTKLGELDVGKPPPAATSPGRQRSSSLASVATVLEVPDHPDDYDQASYEAFKEEWFADHPRKSDGGGGGKGGRNKKNSGGAGGGNSGSRMANSPKFSMSRGVRNPYRDIGAGSKRAAKSFDRALAVATAAEKNGSRSGGGKRDSASELLKLNRMRQRGGGMSLLKAKIAQYGFDSEGNDVLDRRY